jgi:hypothetical protein
MRAFMGRGEPIRAAGALTRSQVRFRSSADRLALSKKDRCGIHQGNLTFIYLLALAGEVGADGIEGGGTVAVVGKPSGTSVSVTAAPGRSCS